MYLILFIGIAILSYVVQSNLNSKFKKYSKIPIASGLSGREVAEKMLRDNGINNVTVTCTKGYLTDHYNPANGTVNLSEAVYNSRSVAAAAVAAHECAMLCSTPWHTRRSPCVRPWCPWYRLPLIGCNGCCLPASY